MKSLIYSKVKIPFIQVKHEFLICPFDIRQFYIQELGGFFGTSPPPVNGRKDCQSSN